MTKTIKTFNTRSWRSFVGVLALVCAMSAAVMAQTPDPYTPGGTVISNTATSTYTDGTDNFETTSNTVSVTVTLIAGLTITPDASDAGFVVRSQTGVDFIFTVHNTGNFTNQVVFEALGASMIKGGTAAGNTSTVMAAFIDYDNNGVLDGADQDILSDEDPVTSADVVQDGTFKVVVRVNVLANALGGTTINIQLGDAPGATPWDNVEHVASANDVVTALGGTDTVKEEARGNIFVTLSNTGSVLLGTRVLGVNYPGATGTTDMNDYTNKSVTTGIMVAPGEVTNASGVAIFNNSVQNTGNFVDTFTFTALSIPTDFTVEVSVNGLGTDYASISDGTPDTLEIAQGATANILIRVTAPSGKLVLTGFPTTIRATSGITPAANNETIDRLYTGYLSLSKGQIVDNATSRGASDEAVPGATIDYLVTYDNMASENGGTNSSPLSAGTVVMVDALSVATDFLVGSAASTVSAGTFAYSDVASGDASEDWDYVPVSAGGGAPALYDRLVRRVRFTKTAAMAPADAASTIGFTVRIR